MNPQPKTMMENNKPQLGHIGWSPDYKADKSPFPADLKAITIHRGNSDTINVAWQKNKELAAELAALKARLAEATKPIKLQDVRLVCGEGRLTAGDTLRAVNVILRNRVPAGEDGGL